MEGTIDGCLLGLCGDAECLAVGFGDGKYEGTTVGLMDGEEGLVVGFFDGVVGLVVGFLEGDEGLCVGSLNGSEEGLVVGFWDEE